ncbi:hypothetical protein, partial [Microcoleus sp. AT9b-C3]|uniref:hypothetical protein n=1 Tax=Microcoleus sp. AT9b-C3 TaxID=2818629 RepID=UPI002FCEAB81
FDINLGVDGTVTDIAETLATEPPITNLMGWVQRWGKWVRGSFLAATEGGQYRMLIEQVGGWSEVLTWPHLIRWETT